MTTDLPDLEHLAVRLLPAAASLSPADGVYEAGHCLAVYHEPLAEGFSLEFPALLAGESLAPLTGRGCTVLEGLPPSPPSGSLVMGLWETLATRYPEALAGVDAPEGEEGYVLCAGRYALLAGAGRNGCIAGAQRLIQLLAAADGTRLPGLILADAPLCAHRGLRADWTHHRLSPETAMRLLGAMNSFGGNRLHLAFYADEALQPEEMPGRIGSDAAREVAQVAAEYGIEVVPAAWIRANLLDDDAPQALCEKHLWPLMDAFDTDALELIFGEGVAPERAEALVRTVLAEGGDALRLTAGAAALEGALRDLPDDAAARCMALVPVGEEESRGLDGLRKRGVSLGCTVPSPTRGVVPGAAEHILAGLEALAAHVKAHRPAAALYSLAESPDGQLWETDLWALTATQAIGWNPAPGATEAARRFSLLVHGDTEGRYLRLLEEMADAFPAAMREDSQLRHFCFGGDVSLEVWKRTRALDLRDLQRQMEKATQRLREFASRCTRNANLLSAYAAGLLSLQFLHSRLYATRIAREHYRAARSGRAGSLGRARQSIHDLREEAERFLMQTRGAFDQTGGYWSEILTLEAFIETLRGQSAALENLDDADTLPPPEEVGFFPDEAVG